MDIALQNWALTVQQLAIRYGDWFPLDLTLKNKQLGQSLV